MTRTLGTLFLRAGFGLAFEKDYPYIDTFDLEILKMREAGFVDDLERKWITGKCPDPKLGKWYIQAYTVKKVTLYQIDISI